MRHIRTTATAVEKLKLEAKQLSKKTGTPLTTARELLAKKAGYDNWKHITVCAASTVAERRSRPLPSPVAEYLAAELRDRPPSQRTREALARGVVFSMDVKDADSAAHDDDVTECEDAMPAVAADLLRSFLEDDEDLAERPSDELLQFCLDELGNYRLFRYGGTRSGPTLDDAFADVLGRYFFPPEHVWLDGRFLAMTDVEEVRVGGKLVLTAERGPNGQSVRSYASPGTAPRVAPAATRQSGARRDDQRHRIEHLVKQLFERPELRAVLSGDVVSLHNSAAGSTFARTADGAGLCVDATSELTEHVVPRLVEMLCILNGDTALLDADIRVDGIELCLSAVLPPASTPSTWAISRRSEVKERARRPVQMDVPL